MRWYHILTGILVILFIVDFALAAPVLSQEKRQARVDVVHIPRPKDTIEKRVEEEIEKLGEHLLKTSAQTTKPPAPNPASSSCWGTCFSTTIWVLKDLLMLANPLHHEPDVPMMPGYGTHGLYYTAPTHPNLRPWSPAADPDFDWDSWLNAPDPPPSSAPPKSTPETPPSPALHMEEGQTSGHGPGPLPTESGSVAHSPSLGTGSLTEPEYDVVRRPSSSPDSELRLNDQSVSADDLQAAIYAAKGKAKESRHISGTAMDAASENAAQSGSQPAERSFDPGSKFLSRPLLFCQSS